ncbi:hypothetical protein HanIR_Chr16g0808391 [Helianthus annuus]|nr:hypothetical protein HanIR_Chr16g0808391 [Helianthus annuus]
MKFFCDVIDGRPFPLTQGIIFPLNTTNSFNPPSCFLSFHSHFFTFLTTTLLPPHPPPPTMAIIANHHQHPHQSPPAASTCLPPTNTHRHHDSFHYFVHIISWSIPLPHQTDPKRSSTS